MQRITHIFYPSVVVTLPLLKSRVLFGTYRGWLQDQAIVLARADRFSTSQQPVEYAMTPRRKKKEPSTLPDVAFGPPERSGDNTENVSRCCKAKSQ